MTDTVDLRYPMGRFTRPTAPLSQAGRTAAIDAIATAPQAFRAAVKGLNAKQLDTSYRPGGWTVRQVVHHLPDSHMNAYCRVKLALTEDAPTIKPYHEDRWAETPDGKSDLVEESLVMLEVLHKRWVYLWKRMQPADFLRVVKHPEWEAPLSVDAILALYAWHGRHHTAHITELRKREGF